MVNRQAILDIPNALEATLAKAPAEYAAVVRQVRWGEGPIYVVAGGGAAPLGLAASYAFEAFLGWPVVARPAEVLQNYTPSLARPRTVLLAISAGGEDPGLEELAQVACRRGSTLVLLTTSPESPLARLTDKVLLVRAEGEGKSPVVRVCLHAALNYLASVAARVLKRPGPQQESQEREFEGLPAQLSWVLAQHAAAVRQLAAEAKRFERLSVVGGGFYHFPALDAACRLREVGGVAAEGLEVTDFHPARRDSAALFISGSRCKAKKLVHHAAAEARVQGMQVLAITDGNDRELAGRSDLGLLTPTLSEVAGGTLALFLAEWLAVEAARIPAPSSS